VARKLSVLLHRLWADGTEVRPAKVEGTTWPDLPLPRDVEVVYCAAYPRGPHHPL